MSFPSWLWLQIALPTPFLGHTRIKARPPTAFDPWVEQRGSSVTETIQICRIWKSTFLRHMGFYEQESQAILFW